MSIYKNVASQKLAVLAWDKMAGGPKTDDAANITAQISKDGAASAASDDTNPTELDSTNHPGVYIFDLTQAETNANLISLTAKSVTANIVLDPRSNLIYTMSVSGGAATEAKQDQIIAAVITNAAGVDIAADIIALKAVADTIATDTTTDIPGLIATAQADLDIITGATGVNLLAATQASIDAIEADTDEMQTDDIPGLIAALENLSAAEVNAEMVDVMKVDTLTELPVEVPPATPTFEEATMFRYMADRNKEEQTASEYRVHNNAGVVICEADLTDDSVTATKSKMRAAD